MSGKYHHHSVPDASGEPGPRAPALAAPAAGFSRGVLTRRQQALLESASRSATAQVSTSRAASVAQPSTMPAGVFGKGKGAPSPAASASKAKASHASAAPQPGAARAAGKKKPVAGAHGKIGSLLSSTTSSQQQQQQQQAQRPQQTQPPPPQQQQQRVDPLAGTVLANGTAASKKPLVLRPWLATWLTNATPLIESWTALGLFVPDFCLASGARATPPTSVDADKFLRFLATQYPPQALLLAGAAVEQASNVWCTARQRVWVSLGEEVATDHTSSGGNVETEAQKQYRLAVRTLSNDFFSEGERTLLAQASSLMHAALPVADTFDFSFVTSVERGARTVAVVEKLIAIARGICAVSSASEQRAIVAAAAAAGAAENNAEDGKGKRKEDGILGLMLRSVDAAEMNVLRPNFVPLDASGSIGTISTPSAAAAAADSGAAQAGATTAATAAVRDNNLTQPWNAFPLFRPSIEQVNYVAGTALHCRGNKRQKLLEHIVELVRAGEGLPVYMRAAAAAAAAAAASSSSSSFASSGNDLFHRHRIASSLLQSPVRGGVGEDGSNLGSIVNSAENSNIAAATASSSSAWCPVAAARQRQQLRASNPALFGRLGLLPDLCDLAPSRFALPAHTAEQVAAELSELLLEHLDFHLYVGEPHDVQLAATAAAAASGDGCGGFLLGDGGSASFRMSEPPASFAALPLRVPLSESVAFYKTRVRVAPPPPPRASQNSQAMGSRQASDAPVPPPSSTKIHFGARNSAGGAAAAAQRQSQQNLAAAGGSSSGSADAAPASATSTPLTVGKQLVDRMREVSRSAEHKHMCWGIIVASLKSSSAGSDAAPSRLLSYVAGIVQLRLPER